MYCTLVWFDFWKKYTSGNRISNRKKVQYCPIHTYQYLGVGIFMVVSYNTYNILWIFIRFYDTYTVKKTRNFTDPVMGNCDKKSTGNRKFTGKCPYILHINGQFTVLLQIFSKLPGNWPYFTGFTVYSPENLLPGNAPFFFQITGHFPAANFPGNIP